MAQIQISVYSDGNVSASGSGVVTDPEVIAAARAVITATSTGAAA